MYQSVSSVDVINRIYESLRTPYDAEVEPPVDTELASLGYKGVELLFMTPEFVTKDSEVRKLTTVTIVTIF